VYNMLKLSSESKGLKDAFWLKMALVSSCGWISGWEYLYHTDQRSSRRSSRRPSLSESWLEKMKCLKGVQTKFSRNSLFIVAPDLASANICRKLILNQSWSYFDGKMQWLPAVNKSLANRWFGVISKFGAP
jgi:hypothetical protein